MDTACGHQYATTTRYTRLNSLRRILRFLWEHHGSPKLDHCVPRSATIRPRCVTAERTEIDSLLDHAKPSLRLFLLLCSDLGIRSGTAVTISPQHYQPSTGQLRFRTKYDEKVGVPVTSEIAEAFELCDLNSSLPFITQLRRQEQGTRGHRATNTVADVHWLRRELKLLRLSLGITKRITPHDLRRTSAVALYQYTGDIRQVQRLLGHRHLQSTLWYLDHDLEPLDRSTLEAIKRPFIIARKGERTA